MKSDILTQDRPLPRALDAGNGLIGVAKGDSEQHFQFVRNPQNLADGPGILPQRSHGNSSYPARSEKILDVPQAHRKPEVEPEGLVNDIR